MRVLTISSPYASHFLPLVPLLRAVVAGGDDIVVVGQPAIVAVARGAGLATEAVGADVDPAEEFHRLPPGRRPIEAGIAQVPAGGWTGTVAALDCARWVYHAKYLLEPYLEIARRWRPDLVLTDPLEFAGLIVGGVLGVPVVHHRWGSEPMTPAALDVARELLGGRAARYGLTGLPDPDLVLVPSPPSWALPDLAGDRLVRPVPYNGSGAAPRWVRQLPPARRVCVSFGLQTLHLGGLPLIRHIVDAFDGMRGGIEALVTIEREHGDRLGPVPAGVRLVEPAPINALTGVVDVMCHHGGGGTAIAALMAGLPHLLLPQLSDQHVRCARIAASGAAIVLGDAADQNDPALIRAALEALVHEPGYRTAAAAVRDEAATLPSPTEVVAMLRDLTAGSRGAPPAFEPAPTATPHDAVRRRTGGPCQPAAVD